MKWTNRAPRRSPALLVTWGLLILVAAAGGIFAAVSGEETAEPSAQSATAPQPATRQIAWDPITWRSVGGAPVPISAVHGPQHDADGVATGFSHDEPGAILAAVNIATRSSGLAGPESTFGPTIANQTTGDTGNYLAAARGTWQEAGRSGVTPALVIGYRVESTSTRDEVHLEVIARQTNPVNAKQWALFRGRMDVRWIAEDWRLVVPTGAGEQIKSVPDGFSPMPGQQLSQGS